MKFSSKSIEEADKLSSKSKFFSVFSLFWNFEFIIQTCSKAFLFSLKLYFSKKKLSYEFSIFWGYPLYKLLREDSLFGEICLTENGFLSKALFSCFEHSISLWSSAS